MSQAGGHVEIALEFAPTALKSNGHCNTRAIDAVVRWRFASMAAGRTEFDEMRAAGWHLGLDGD
jgi:hypothetical protein